VNILLIDYALPSSVFSGKTVRLKNIYGRLAKSSKIIFLRTAQPGEEKESKDLELWSKETFAQCLRMPALPAVKLADKIRTLLTLKPWFDIFSKYSDSVKDITLNLRNICKEHAIDVVITFNLEVAQYGLLASEFCPWIQDLGDSMILQMRRQSKKASSFKQSAALLWRLLRETRFEYDMVQKAASTIFVAEEDAALHRKVSFQIHIIPNGVDTDYFNPDIVNPIGSEIPYLVFTGHMNFPPNQDAAAHFANNIFPMIQKKIPHLGFKIVGADPTPEVLDLAKNDGVEVTGFVDDVRPYLRSAAAFVCPMRMGSGIKNKLLEAMAMNLPVVASSLAVAGIEGFPRETIAVEDAPLRFAEKCVDFVVSKISTKRTTTQSRDFVQKQYSWGQAIGKYESLINKALSAAEAKA